MEMELEPRVKPLTYKIKGVSRESASQKASHVLDTDLRNHWSTGTNTKEWILLELDEPCLLSQIRIYNKSVLEWEISVGLHYKPETFSKVRPRCEAPRRDMMYPMNYTACKYVRISFLRGNPIAIFFIQLIGVPVAGLEPEFHPVLNYLLPHIISHKQDAQDMHLQLLQDLTSRLVTFLPQLESDLNSFPDVADHTIRFLAMLSGPFYPILHIVNERETARSAGNALDAEASKNSLPLQALTVSSNFEPRRSRNALVTFSPASTSIVFRPDVILMLLRKAYKDSHLGTVCRMASRALRKLAQHTAAQEAPVSCFDVASVSDEASDSELFSNSNAIDYSSLFGEEFRIIDDHWETKYLDILDIKAVEEGILHVLYACVSQPLFCSKLAGSSSDFWLTLPLIQALLPALRPNFSRSDQVDDIFSQWRQSFVQQALSQIVAMSTSPVYRPLLHGCAGYLSSFSPSHAKSACVLIDLCSGVLSPWLAQVIAKVDLVVELVEDLLGIIQGAHNALGRARAALKYIVLALSGHMDDVMAKYKEVKHKVFFLIEILEPFLDPALTPLKNVIAFGNVSPIFLESQEHNCTLALNVIRTAVKKSAILPSLESEWRRGSVAPSVLLSILEPHMQLPPNVDLCTFPTSDLMEPKLPGVTPLSSAHHNGGACLKSPAQDVADRKADVSDTMLKTDSFDDASLLFAPTEVRDITLLYVSAILDQKNSDYSHRNINSEEKDSVEKKMVKKHRGEGVWGGFSVEYSNLHADYVQLMNFRDCELWASEFRRLAFDLHSQTDITPDSHNASIDALLLAAECYINPSFMMSFRDFPKLIPETKISRTNANFEFTDINTTFRKNADHLETVARLEWKRDKIVLQILLEAAELHQNYQNMVSDTEDGLSCSEENDEAINLSLDDMTSVDAITLVRQNQALLCKFLIGCLLKERHSMREILMQSLVFLLHSATKLYCAPEDIIHIILESAEYLNGLLSDYHHQSKEGGLQLESKMVHELERHWLLLRRLVIASSGSEEGSESSINIGSGTRFTNLISPSAWLQKIPTFSSSTSPLVRFVGWMAVSRNANQYQKERLFLAADLPQLTILLSIFADELSVVDNIVEERDDNKKSERLGVQQDVSTGKGHELSGQNYEDQSFRTIYPETSWFFPNLKEQFNAFGETILEAIRLHLRSLSSTVVPDLLCWFADLCSWPLLQKEDDTLSFSKSSFLFKGFLGKNAKVVILYILETIVIEHMEAMVPETPRVVQVLVSLCRTSYCDVPFLDSILCLLNPIISYSLKKVIDEELLVDDSCLNFESLCFDELLSYIKSHNEKEENVTREGYSRAPTILVLASVFPDLSFQRKREILQCLGFWADFASFEPTTSFYDYICAFQMLLESCKVLQVGTLRVLGVIPLKTPLYPKTNNGIACDNNSEPHTWFLRDAYMECENNVENTAILDQKGSYLSMDEVVEFSKDLESLIFTLNPTMELCWKLHYQLAKKLTLILAECFVYSRCLSAVSVKVTISEEVDTEYTPLSNLVDNIHWKASLEGLAQIVLVLQEKHCWEVSSTILNCLLGGPYYFVLDNVISSLCSAIKIFSCSAPKIAWRLQTDAWLSSLFARGVQNLHGSEEFLVVLLCSMLRHPEPEQRYIAIKQFGKLLDQDVYGQTRLLSSTSDIKLSSTDPSTGSQASILSPLVSSAWDLLSLLASSDTSVFLRSKAMELLVKCVPFAERHQLQSLLGASDSVFPSLRNLGHQTCEGPMTQLSLALIVSICLYSPPEDICLIPRSIWRNIETLGMSEIGTRCDDPGRKACHALCRLQKEGDKAKVVLKEVILSSSSKEGDPDFESTRESLLRVLGNLTSVQSYFEFLSKKTDEKLNEIEEAEIEMDLLQKDQSLQELSNDFGDWRQLPFLARYKEEDRRLQQIKDNIRLLEKAKLKEEVIARRQKKLFLQHARQKYLEDVALHEAQLLQDLDRERATEMEKEIERQRSLELERTKTRELRHNLDMEKEKQTQKELQRELEQAESGVRPSRRDLSSSTHSGRPRERYRERENGRTTNEGNLRTSSGSLQTEFANPGSSMPSAPTVVLSGSRQFSAQLPTILQSRDKPDDGGSSYEENFDGSRDSGDTGSVGDPDLVTALEGQTSVFGLGQIHGSRGNKSRQMTERRERDNRREGKWERKH